jgi:hypothetical protein
MCIACDTISIHTVDTSYTKTLIDDSSWERENATTYVSDISPTLSQLNISPSQIYQMNIVSGNSIINIFPATQVTFMQGTILATVTTQGNTSICAIEFVDSDQDTQGVLPSNVGFLPFTSIEMEILVRK